MTDAQTKTELINKIKSDVDTARKNRHESLTMLSTIYAEVSMIGKNNGNRETTDSEIVSYCKKCIKNNDNTINTINNKELSEKYSKENEYLKTLLPEEVSDDVVHECIKSIIDNTPESERNMRLIGKIMQTLKKQYGDTLNSGKASTFIKKLL